MRHFFALFACLFLPVLFKGAALNAQATYTIRVVPPGEDPEAVRQAALRNRRGPATGSRARPTPPSAKDLANARAERLLQRVLEVLHNSERVDVLPATDTTGVATHLVETHAGAWIKNDAIRSSAFNDSLATASFVWDYAVDGVVELLFSEVETGKILGMHRVPASASSSETYKLTYKDVKWDKSKNRQDPKQIAQLVAAADPIIRKVHAKQIEAAYHALVQNAGGQARWMHNQVFPFRLAVLDVAGTKKDKLESVLIEGGRKYDLRKGDELVAYTVRNMSSGGSNFERFTILGRLRYAEDHERGGVCQVLRGREAIQQALSGGTKIWCRPGSAPHTLQEASQDIKVAIGALHVPHDLSVPSREYLYRRIRAQALARKGVTLVEREKLDNIQAERDRSKQEAALDQAAIAQYQAVGADLLLEIGFGQPTVKTLYGRTMTLESPMVGVDVTATYTLRLLDVETGELLNEKSGRHYRQVSKAEAESIQSELSQKNSSAALERACYLHVIGSTNFDIAGLINEVFPPKISVVEVTEEKKGKAQEVLLAGEFNLKLRDRYYVMRKRTVTVDGEDLVRFEQVGIVMLRDSEGEGVATAKVKEGEREILTAMQAGEELFCVDKPNFFERLDKRHQDNMRRYGY